MLALIISARRGSRVRNPFAGTDMGSSWKVDDATHARDPIRRCRFPAIGKPRGTQVSAYELGRGHRQERQAAAPNPMGASRGELTLNLGRNCNFLLTDEAHTGELYAPA